MRKPFWVAATRSYASPNCGAAVYKGIHIKKQNTGLLLFGDVGTGKSFFAGCIANALLDRDVPVLMTNFPSILNRLTGVFAEDRAAFIASLDDYSLFVIDDLGVERNTEYAMGQMFIVIDSRYRSKKPGFRNALAPGL